MECAAIRSPIARTHRPGSPGKPQQRRAVDFPGRPPSRSRQYLSSATPRRGGSDIQPEPRTVESQPCEKLRHPEGPAPFRSTTQRHLLARLPLEHLCPCLLYTSDAADDLLCVDLGGRRI